MGPLVPVIIITATLTLKSDTKPIPVKVNKPRGTLYWGGAGLNGPYVQPQLAMFAKVGISHCYIGQTNSASQAIGDAGMLIDALRAGINIRYIDDGEWPLSGMDKPSEQFNLIGYSYGSLLAAQTANYYAKNGNIVNHLVLIGSPIDADFLQALKANKNIKKVIVIDLVQHGDPIYAGIKQSDLIMVAKTLAEQMTRNKAEGHFYYAHVVDDSPKRWEALAHRLYEEGLR
ncbi:alpha/beta hydrolase [Iodobacter sp. CM08]|uniref:alpha/beta hydrolase n=1 Tax=Iodobacter sp. CM08 TaxID=3085902 RepID=UPI002982927F|nr:alpha/beta hydrolase [Iodobacter sp. CM08]MDW5418591.1 alpha/beta hydrolase [Iodobacter sp. CM08]